MANFKMQEKINLIAQKVENTPVLRLFFSHTLLSFIYGTFLFLYEIKFLRELVPVVHPFLIFWSGVLILYDIFVRQIWKKVPFWQPLLLFLISAAVTAVINFEAGIVSNFKAFILTALPLFIFYPACILTEKSRVKKTLILSTIGASVVAFAASLSAIVMYLIRFSETITILGIEETVGFVYYYPNDPDSAVILYGAYIDTNHASLYAIVFAFLSVVLFMFCKKGLFSKNWMNKLGKIYAVANIFVQLCYFPLANSRGGWLSLGIALFISSALYFNFAKLKISKKAIRGCVSVLLAVVCVAVTAGGLLLLRTGAAKATILTENIIEFVESLAASSGSGDKKEEIKHEFPSADKFDKKDDGSGAGRLDIWRETVDLYVKRPILGVGPGNTEYFGMKYNIPGERIKYGADIHNSYLDLITDYGAVGFILLALFWLKVLICVIREFIKKGAQKSISYYICAFMLLFTCGGAAFLSCAFINTTAVYFVMLILTGYLVSNSDIKGRIKQ